MRTSSLRAVLMLACAALVVIAGACQARASFLNLLPSDILSGSRAQVRQADNTQNDFFSIAIGMIPASDEVAKQQLVGLLGIKKSYDSTNVPLPQASSRKSWMSPLMKIGTPGDTLNTAAMSSYGQLIKRFNNQSNIFGD